METLLGAFQSVQGFHGRVKLFFVDGGSTDGSRECLEAYVRTTGNGVLLVQDGTGLYQALNQGMQAAIGDPDVTHIGLLHSDDELISGTFEAYLTEIEESDAPVFYSDIEFHNVTGDRVRVWESGPFSKFKLNTGWMPPHTSMVVSTQVYRDIGLYNPDFGTAADYEWIVRVMSKYGADSCYFPQKTLSMLVGGASSASLRARLRANAMDGQVWAEKSKLQSLVVRVCKPARKIGQFF
jgi:glycosyltransferase